MNDLSGKMDVVDVLQRAEVLFYVFQDKMVRLADATLEIKVEKRFVKEETVEGSVEDGSFVLVTPDRESGTPQPLTNEETMQLLALMENDATYKL